ncbi:Uma2 family endonuclease [Leucothrix pacifica]|uniref:Putative restriction endonuclease domain-containing protein n=1 Tax=Leucothrix pacifica TaxID=1247513 RepID=A0A317CI81_9GAMM|nr:Uma2 family endonuclease [Leucothrix pacifica]PWQ96020.1 hypothetical protein DKW60_13725 [Leucothrix pacifica]
MPPLANQLSYIDPTDYLTGERNSEVKHEYVQGKVYAMAGAALNHNRIVRNLSSLLWNQMQDQPCEPVTGDMLLKTAEDKYRYPDLMVVCEDDESTDDYVRENPTLIVEVLSASTRRVDKTDKHREYLELPSVQEYVLIEQDFVEIAVWRRSANWQVTYYYLDQDVTFESVGITLSVGDIYQRVDNVDMQAFIEQKAQESE